MNKNRPLAFQIQEERDSANAEAHTEKSTMTQPQEEFIQEKSRPSVPEFPRQVTGPRWKSRLAAVYRGYSERPEPLAEYAFVLGGYLALVTTTLLLLRMRGTQLPRRMTFGELVLLSLGTHKLARLISLDWVTSPVRAPFTKFEKSTGEGEVRETARGTGERKVIGELLSCPYCMGVWVATAFGFGRVIVPRLTNFVAGIFALTAISDFLQRAYAATKRTG